MTWTTEFPADDGFYWLRYKKNPHPQIVEVFDGDAYFIGCDHIIAPEQMSNRGAEYAGPIPQPQ